MSKTPRDFKARQEYYLTHPLYRQHQNCWIECYESIISALRLLQHRTNNIKSIVELGCNDGSLAVECLNNLSLPLQWVGYDIHKPYIDQSKQHSRYQSILLEKQLWEYNLQPFDVFVSSHTLEHLYSDEIEKLAEWLSKHSKYLILCVPLRPDHGKLRGDHILDKGSDWLVELFKKNGFSLIWQNKGWFGWFKH